MNRNRLVIIGFVAMGLAVMVSYMMYSTMRKAIAGASRPPAQLVSAVAADTDLALGARIEAKDVRLVQVPPDSLPLGSFDTVAKVVGRGVLAPMSRNELVLAGKVAGENSGAGLPAVIPDGMRAVSVKVNDVVAVAGFVTPGTRVDVVLTGNPSKDGDPAKITTTTVLENVQVLAAGQKMQRSENGEPQQVTVITLLVKPDEAQKLVLASSEGHIQLALRNALDSTEATVPVLKNASLYHFGIDEPKVYRAAKPKPALPMPYVVELIRGDKRDASKF